MRKVKMVLSECCQERICGFGALSLKQKALRHLLSGVIKQNRYSAEPNHVWRSAFEPLSFTAALFFAKFDSRHRFSSDIRPVLPRQGRFLALNPFQQQGLQLLADLPFFIITDQLTDILTHTAVTALRNLLIDEALEQVRKGNVHGLHGVGPASSATTYQ